MITTPGVAYLTKTLDVQAGIMISASHNPVQDNEIKIFSRNGYKLSDDQEDVKHYLMRHLNNILNEKIFFKNQESI